MLFLCHYVEVVLRTLGTQVNPHLACDEAQTWSMYELELQQGVPVTQVAAETAEGPVCVKTMGTNGDSAIFSQHSLFDGDQKVSDIDWVRRPERILPASSSIFAHLDKTACRNRAKKHHSSYDTYLRVEG